MHAKRLHPLAVGVLVPALACFAASLVAVPAGAQCSYTPLVDGTPVTVSASPAFYTVDQPYSYWTAVAVKPPSGADWDISIWQDTYVYPSCVTTQLTGSSLGSGVDFVVGDYNHNAFGTRYVEVNRYSGTGNGTLEWNATDGQLPINGPLVTASFGEPIHIYDVYLEAGTTYAFTLDRTAPADIHLLLFRNATGGTCWKRRLDAEFDITSSTTYTAPGTGYYGVVVVKDDWANADARIRVSACTAPYALTSGEPVGSGLAENYFSLDQQQTFWTAVGLRGNQYWEMSVYRSDPGNPIGACFSDLLAGTSSSSTTAGVVVGDFNYNATGTYYVKSRFPIDWYTGPGYVQWDDGPDQLAVNGMITHGTMSNIDIVRAWDVYLEAGTVYHFTFSPSGADLKLLLFRNPGASEYWAGRNDKVLSTATGADYTAPASGHYGVVIVNDDGGTGTYAVGVGSCTTPVALGNGVPYTTALGENYVQFFMDYPYWTVIGVRGSDPATDWDMVVQSGSTAQPFPVCRSPQLGVSEQGPPTVDFVVGDFNHNAMGTSYAWPHTWLGEGSGTGTVLWNRTGFQLEMNGPSVYAYTSPGHFVQPWDVQLTAGTQYSFMASSNIAGHRLLLFRNPSSGVYWAPRSSAEFEVVVPEGGGVAQSYTAPATDWYGVVVVNDQGLTGRCGVRVGACVPPTALTAGTTTTSVLLESYYSITQGVPFWTAVGVRSSSLWDLVVHGTSGGNSFARCFSNELAYSHPVPPSGSTSAVVVGDFNHDPYGTYYLWATQRYDPGATGTVEWDSGIDAIVVGGPAVNRATGPNDVLEAWDCWLEPQKYYTFHFTHTGTADLKLLVFRNTAGGVYWAPREGAQIELPASATWKTPGTAGDHYGLVVVNDNGQPGSYSLQVTDPGTVEVPESPLPATVFSGVRPNPARGGAQLVFGLREAATVSFQVIDMTGRRVATLPGQVYDAGHRTVAWDGRSERGSRLPAGIYFVRMVAGGRVIGSMRLVLLD